MLFSKKKISAKVLVVGVAILMAFFSHQAEAVGSRAGKAKSLASYTMGVIYDLQGLTEEAIDEFQKSAKHEDNSAVHLRLGADFARLGQLPEAIAELNKAAQYDPDNVQARYLLALIYSTQKEFEKASQQYEMIVESFPAAEPENVELYHYLADLYYYQGQFKKAVKQYEAILEIVPDNTQVMFFLGSLYVEMGRKNDAAQLFSRALKYDPNDANSLNSLGYVYAEQGRNLDEAQNLIERALEIDPENGNYLDSLGWVYYKKGEYEKALDYLKKADQYCRDPILFDHLGDVYLKLNQPEKAEKFWRSSLEIRPDQDAIKEKIRLLK